MKSKILEMVELQNNLNSKTGGENWKSGVTNSGKIINWKRCCYMELAEAIDSIPWKHWKNILGEVDYENFRIEMVDIFHFVLSYGLTILSPEKLCEKIISFKDVKSDTKLPKYFNETNNLELDKILLPYENFMALSLKKDNSEENLDEFLKSFFECLDSSGISFDELYKLYIGKNVLNKFRQDNGYKEGTYIKIWDGQEDNVHMQKVLEFTTGFDDIYNELHKIYKTLN